MALQSAIRRLKVLLIEPDPQRVQTALARLQQAAKTASVHLPDPEIMDLLQQALILVQHGAITFTEMRLSEDNGRSQKISHARKHYAKAASASELYGHL